MRLVINILFIGLLFAYANAKDLVVMLLPENVNPRWEKQDAYFFKKSMEKLSPNIEVEIFNANNNPSVQQRQAEQALTRGAKVLIVIPIDGESSSVIVDMANGENVPVIAYDRMINNKKTSFWIQASMEKIGESQAKHVVDNTKDGDTLVLLKGSPTDPNAAVIYKGQMNILKPLFDSKKRKLGYESWIQGWDPAIARRSMDQALTKLKNNVQAVVSSNDGNAGAAIAALQEVGLKNVPVTGLDGTVQALQLILLGEQTQTTWRPFNKMAQIAAKITSALINQKNIKSLVSGTIKNKAGGNIPFVPAEYYSAVGEKGVAYIIKHDPTISKKDVCKGRAKKTNFCNTKLTESKEY